MVFSKKNIAGLAFRAKPPSRPRFPSEAVPASLSTRSRPAGLAFRAKPPSRPCFPSFRSLVFTKKVTPPTSLFHRGREKHKCCLSLDVLDSLRHVALLLA